MALGRKTYRFRFFDHNGHFLGEPAATSAASFRKVINAGLGDLTLDLPLTFIEAYSSPYTAIGNQVEMIVSDSDTSSDGVLMYSGFVAERSPRLGGTNEGVSLLCRGYATRFPFLPLKSGNVTRLKTHSTTGLTTGLTASTATIDLIIKAIIDRYNAEAFSPMVNYAPGSIEPVGNTLTYTLSTKTIQYAIEKVMESAPSGTYWRVDADNVFYLRSRSTKPRHLLSVGSQVTQITDRESIDGLVNHVLFGYNGAPATAARVTTDVDSAFRYGDWWDMRVDGRYTVEQNVINVSAAEVGDKKLPPRRTTITVPDNNGSSSQGYDIETLNPGDTVKLLNLPAGAQEHFPSLFQIMAVDYSLGSATLELETLRDDLSREVARKERSDQGNETEDMPRTYTS